MKIDYQQIGRMLKQARKEQHLTQEELAEQLDVSVGYISQLERGVTKISLDTLGSISSLLKREPTYFLTGSVPQQNNYLEHELTHIFFRLSPDRKRLLLEIAEVLTHNSI